MSAELHQLEAKLEQLQLESENGLLRCKKLQSDKVKKKIALGYLSFARLARKPSIEYGLWSIGIRLVSSALGAAIGLCITYLAGGSNSAILALSILGAATGLALSAIVLIKPCNEKLVVRIAELTSDVTELETAIATTKERADSLANQVKRTELERRVILSSGILQRRALLAQNWKEMRGTEFENYLKNVFQALGAEALHTGKAGDQGTDLIVVRDSQKIAIQVKGYYNSVNNKAVQEANAGMGYHDCNTCAVITNSRFTKRAIELAEKLDCVLIGENELPILVMGDHSLCPLLR